MDLSLGMVAGVMPVANRARRRTIVIAVVAALVAVSCSTGSDEVTDPTTGRAETTDAPATSAVPTTSAATTGSPAATGAPSTTAVPDSTVSGGATDPTTDPTTRADEPKEISADGDLYASPDPIPDQPHGTLLRYQEVTPSVHANSRTWRMMYLSESVAGDAIVVTGLAVVPRAPAPPDGRNIVTLTHGTTGSADVCAPSMAPNLAGELLLLGPSVAAGSIIAATD